MNYHFDTLNDDIVLIDCYGNVEWVDLVTRSIPSEGAIEVSVELVERNDSNLIAHNANDTGGIRARMLEWLHFNGYTTRINVDFASQGSVIAATLSAKTIVARFFEGDYAPLIDRYQVYWINANRTGIIEDDKFVTEKSARAYVMAGFIKPFITAAGESVLDDILDGTVYITRTHANGDFYDIPFDPRDLLAVDLAA